VLLCRRHHHAHHDGDFFIVPLGRGTFRFHRADGLQLPDFVDPTGLCDTPGPAETEYPGVSYDAATTRRDGTRLDHDYGVAGLARGPHRVNRLSAAEQGLRSGGRHGRLHMTTRPHSRAAEDFPHGS
jgi:hypothetical protein